MSRVRLSLFLLIAISPLDRAGAYAQAVKPLRFSISTVGLSVRSGAPLDVIAELRWNEPRLLVGRLDLQLLDKDRVVGRYLSEELTLAEGAESFRFMLPPMKGSGDFTQIDVVPRFITSDRVIDLGEPGDYQLRVPSAWKRVFVIASSEPAEQVLPGLGVDLFRSMRLEQFANNHSLQSGLGTTVVRMPPSDFPLAGLGYFSYDVAVVAGEGFSQLGRKQLTALADWAEAGGSVLVVPNQALRAEHAEFLNRIVVGSSGAPQFFLDQQGSLSPPATGTLEKPTLAYPSLGRAVVLREPLNENRDNIDSAAWRRIVAFLWKIRNAEIESIAQNGKWTYEAASPDFSNLEPYRPLPLGSENTLDLLLAPSEVQGVPFSVVGTMLVLFLLAIGPGDYYLLGYLKARKYTWILLPVTALAFTGFMVFYAQHHMGSTDYRSGLVVVDVGEGGKVLRTSRFERVFVATQKTVDTELKDSLFAPFDPPAPDEDIIRLQTLNPSQFERLMTKQSVALLENRMPLSFVIHDEMQKWSPKVNRYTSLVPKIEPPEFDWDSVDPNRLGDWGTDSGRQAIRDNLLRAFPNATVVLMNSHLPNDAKGSDLESLMQSISTRVHVEHEKLFRVVSQTSPTGAGDFEDLPILDLSDRTQYLLAVATTQGDDIIVYRRLFRMQEEEHR